jgi:hypothetical protein
MHTAINVFNKFLLQYQPPFQFFKLFENYIYKMTLGLV